MADDSSTDESNLSKRERQKLRREQRLAREQAQRATARRRQRLVTGLIVLVVVGLIGWAVYGWLADRREQEELIAQAEERREELGCTDSEQLADAGAGHFGGGELATSPPEAVYTDRPAASGQHIGRWALTGVYDHPIDERLLVHNLEHGYVVMYYDATADEGQVTALKEFARAEIEGEHPKVIVAPWVEDELPQPDANFAYVAWHNRQVCAEFDSAIPEAFLVQQHGTSGDAPEGTIEAHTDPGQNGTVAPPEDGPLLFPPLGGAEAGGEAMSDGATDGSEPPSPSS